MQEINCHVIDNKTNDEPMSAHDQEGSVIERDDLQGILYRLPYLLKNHAPDPLSKNKDVNRISLKDRRTKNLERVKEISHARRLSWKDPRDFFRDAWPPSAATPTPPPRDRPIT
jgi:hypothetical protein